jgi:ribonuclease-3
MESRLNPKNVYITEQFIYSIFEKFSIDAKVNNLGLYQKAMTHNSYCCGGKRKAYGKVVPFQDENYERMEWFGDKVLGEVVARYLFYRFPDMREGFLTKLHSKIVRGTTLAKLSLVIGLDKYVLLSAEYDEENEEGKSRQNERIMNNVMESFIAAIRMDTVLTYKEELGEIDKFRVKREEYERQLVVEKFIIGMIEKYLDLVEMITVETNHRDMLKKFHFKNGWSAPIYKQISVTGNPNNKIYTVGAVDINDEIIGIGEGISNKKATQDAAKKALEYYEEL